jgi:hypothetical protein
VRRKETVKKNVYLRGLLKKAAQLFWCFDKQRMWVTEVPLAEVLESIRLVL